MFQDLSGGNSNDSSGGPAPGTPNSQGMRPTPSPTGSTGSRSMSPAVGQYHILLPSSKSHTPLIKLYNFAIVKSTAL